MNRGVIYFSHGTKHLVRLMVSIWSLRQHYVGPITVLTTDPNITVNGRQPLRELAQTKGFDVDLAIVPLARVRRHSCYVTKASLWRYTPYLETLFLDCDTLVAGPISGMFNWCQAQPIFTQFSDWTMETTLIRKRVELWRDVEPDRYSGSIRELVDRSLSEPYRGRPAINTGVFAFNRGSQETGPILEDWEDLAQDGWRQFICDEIAAQLLVAVHPYYECDDRYNCSPIYGRHKSEAVIWHFHGSKHLRPESFPIWWPVYRECLAANFAGLRDWTPAGDQRLAGFQAGGVA